MFRRKAADAVDTVAAAVITTGMKVGGEKGGQVANKVTGTVLGREYKPCTDPNCRGC
ncbi:hypothetical protein [Streptomyces violaceus]|uniref:Uncharacterized protein n=1 Tax=Streptomyces violaceus TaxID=1936 RepID=A0ABZ1NKW0_STRVL